MPRIKTLTVDLENPDRIIRRTSRGIAERAMGMARTSRLDAHLLTKPSGMDLLKAADRAILEEALDEVRPELLVIGPLYKAFLDPGGRTSESIAIEVAKYLDTIRTVYRCALWIEHHAPLGTSMSSRDLRPFGSAVWSRWPEFGISLQPDPMALGDYVYDVRHFRGARDERQWPTKMKRGKTFPFEVLEFMTVGKDK
jgi:replicative DNA helicase